MLQQNLSVRRTGGCETILLRCRPGAWIATYPALAPSPELVCLCCGKVWLEGMILLTLWASEDCGNTPAADKVLVSSGPELLFAEGLCQESAGNGSRGLEVTLGLCQWEQGAAGATRVCVTTQPLTGQIPAPLCACSAQNLSEIWATSSKGADKDKCWASVWFLGLLQTDLCVLSYAGKLLRNFLSCVTGIH